MGGVVWVREGISLAEKGGGAVTAVRGRAQLSGGRRSKRAKRWGGASVLFCFFSSSVGVVGWLDKYGFFLGFSVCPSFKILPPSLLYMAEFHVYKNLYTCCSRKYCNNYYKDCLL